mgnify:CR=1 FL=1
MKIIHFLYAALAAAAITSCDEHREFPDTAMKTCDILCTDGDIVRYEDVEKNTRHPLLLSSS